MKNIVIFLFLVFLLSVNFVGCSISRALNQPDKKDISVLKVGTHRDLVIAELGSPTLTRVDEKGNEYDIYSFIQGFSKGNKVARAFGHGVVDVFTLGLWEVLANPIEGIASGKKVKIKITYDKEKKVATVEELKIPLPEKK